MSLNISLTWPISDIKVGAVYNATCNIIPGGDDDKSLHKYLIFYSFSITHRSDGKSYNWNSSLFRRLHTMYTEGVISSGMLAYSSNFPSTGLIPQCTTVLFPFQKNVSRVSTKVPELNLFPPTLTPKHPLVLMAAPLFSLIIIHSSLLLVIKIKLCNPFVAPSYFHFNTRITCLLHMSGYGRGLLLSKYSTLPLDLFQKFLICSWKLTYLCQYPFLFPDSNIWSSLFTVTYGFLPPPPGLTLPYINIPPIFPLLSSQPTLSLDARSIFSHIKWHRSSLYPRSYITFSLPLALFLHEVLSEKPLQRYYPRHYYYFL